MPAPDSRPRGILTPDDRALLRGEVEYEHRQQYSNRRKTIRERIANGLLDFSLIWYTLRDRDRKRIFQNPAGEAGIEDAQFSHNLECLLTWVYLGLKEQNRDFEGLLTEAIEEAEEEYARKYRGESVDITVTFDVEVSRSQNIDSLIDALEEGGPVPADQLYNLLQLSRGVPIDTSELDTVRVWFRSSYPEGEKAVLESIFSEYLGVDVEVEDAENRVDLSDEGLEKDSAVIEKHRSRPEPSKIKNYTPQMADPTEESVEKIRIEANRRRDSRAPSNQSPPDESILEQAIDWHFEDEDESRPTIEQIINSDDLEQRDVAPETVVDLLEMISDPVVSTGDIATAFESTPEASQEVLSKAADQGELTKHSVRDDDGDLFTVWSLSSA